MQIKKKQWKKIKRLAEFLEDADAIILIEQFSENEQKRLKNGTYNREGIDDQD